MIDLMAPISRICSKKCPTATSSGRRTGAWIAALLGWSGRTTEGMVGERFSDFLAMADRIYYETHIAPLLRDFFNEFAIDMLAVNAKPMQMFCQH